MGSQIRRKNERRIPKKERCARRDAWQLAKDVYKLKRSSKDTFYSLAEAWVVPAPSSTKPEERHFVIDSGASMHMLSKKGLELRRVGDSQVVTANGEVRTNEEAQVHVHDLHLFVTVQSLEDIPAVFSLGNLCKEHGCIYGWPSGRESRLTKKWESDPLQNRELRPIGSSRTIIKFYHSFVFDITPAGSIHFFGSSKYAKKRGSCRGL